MRPTIAAAVLCISLMLSASAGLAQRDTTTRRAPTTGRLQASMQPSLTPNRDVILEVPELYVDSIGLTIKDVHAHVSLDANAMNLVQITAGIDVGIKQVQLGIVGVYGQVYLYVDLDNVARIVDRVVLTLDRNPEVLTQTLKGVDTAVNAITAPLSGQPPTNRPPQ